MAAQDQNIDRSHLDHSQVQLAQAEQNAVSFQSSDANQVTINNIILRLFGQPTSSGIDWEWAKNLLEQKQLPEIRKRLTDTLGRDRTLMSLSLEEQLGWGGTIAPGSGTALAGAGRRSGVFWICASF